MKKVSALTHSKYKKFVDERDRAAEKMLGNFRLKQTDILRRYLRQAYDVIINFLITGKKDIRYLDAGLHSVFIPAIDELTHLTDDLRKKTYTLCLVSETEAIARLKGKATYSVTKQAVDEYIKTTQSMAGGHTKDRVALFLDRLRRSLVDSVQIGLTKKEDIQSIFNRTVMRLPHLKRQRVVRELSKIKESDKKLDANGNEILADDVPDEPLTTGFVDAGTWDQIVSDYTDDYIPEWRGPEYQIDPNEPGWPDDEKVYATDIEREMTEDFVKSVRDGQIEAANQNGIDDFVWIAIIDDKTDDCCLERDGLLTSEIEKMMETGELDDDCDASTPPAHINCRCRLAPAIDSDLEPVTVDTGGFSDWANEE